MKYSPNIYAIALTDMMKEIPKSHHDELIDNFCSNVIRNGDGAHLDQIITAVEERETHDHGGKVISIEFARDMNDATVEKITKKFRERDMVSVKITPSLIAGTRITIDDEQELDQSLQRKLRKLWPTK